MKKTFAILTIIAVINVFTPFRVFAASPPAVNGVITGGFNTPRANTLTFAHTVGAGLTNSLLVLMCANNDTKANNATLTATWNGVSMTLGTSTNVATANMWQGAFYLAAPGAATANIVVTNTLAGGSRFYCGAYTLTGAAQSNPFDISSTTGTGTTARGATTTMTTLTANTLVIENTFSQATNINQTWVPDSTQTQGFFIQANTNQEPTNGSYKTQATAGSVTMAENFGGASTNTGTITQLAVAIIPAASTASFDFGQWFPF